MTSQLAIANVACMHKNVYLCTLAVEKLTDQSALAIVAKLAENSSIAINAFDKISDMTAIIDVAKFGKYTDVREAAIRILNDQSILSDLAQFDNNIIVRQAALDKLTDQTLLEIINNTKDDVIQQAALNRLTDQCVVTDLAKSSKSLKIRKIAIEYLTDQVMLSDIAKNEIDISLCDDAFNKLTDQDIIFDVANNAQNKSIRAAAIQKLNDSLKLAEIAENDKDSYVRIAAVEKLTDQNVLAKIVMTNTIPSVRHAAIKKLSAQSILIEVAKNDEQWYARRLALDKIDMQTIIAEIAKNDKEPAVRIAAIMKLNDQNILAEIAKQDQDEYACKIAFDKLIKEDLIFDVAKITNVVSICKAAFDKIIEQSIIAQFANIALNTDDIEICKIAICQMTDEKHIATVEKSLLDDSLREIADRLTNLELLKDIYIDLPENKIVLDKIIKLACLDTDDRLLNFMVDISISKKGQDNEFNVLLEQIKFLDYISSVVVLAKIAKHAYWDKIKLIASNKIIEISKICNDDRCFDIIYDLAKDINHYKSKFNLFRALMENAGMTDIVSFLDCLSDFCEYDAFEKIGQPEIQSILNQYSLNEMKHDVIVTQLTKIVDSILSTICSRNGINTPRKTIFDMFGNEYGLYIHELNIPIKTINYKPIYYYRGEFMSIPFYIKDYPKKDELDEFNKYFKYSIDLIKNLCNTVIATNILYNLSKKTDIDIKLSGSCGSEYKLEISNKPIRDMAREELARRGNPPYDISAYAEFITNRSK